MKLNAALLNVMVCLSISASAQTPFFQHYKPLPKNQNIGIRKMFQDRSGYIWLGTDKGLFRFDGTDYHRYTRNDSLPDNFVTALAQDSLGRIWGGCQNGHLFFIDNGKPHAFEPPEGSPAAEVSDILFDRKGNLWFSTLNDGLYYIRLANERVYRLDEQNGLPDLFIYDIEEADDGTIWAGTDGGLAHISLTNGNPVVTAINYEQGLPDNIVKHIISANAHTLWIGTEDAGIFSYDPGSNKFTPLMRNWTNGALNDFLLQGNEVWIASNSGLTVYNPDSQSKKSYETEATSVNMLFSDREGNIWLGSRAGLWRTPGDRIELIDGFEGVNDVNIIALAVDHSGAIWFSNKEGLYKRSMDDRGRPHTRKFPLNTAGHQQSVISIYVDSKGFVWAGLYGEGAVRIDPATERIQHILSGLRNGNILHVSGKGNIIWLATLGGASRLDISQKDFAIKNFSTNDGLVSDFIYQVYADNLNRTWFATDGKGAVMLDNHGFHSFKELAGRVVYGFAQDGAGRIWANVQGEGLFGLENGGFIPYRDSIALRDDNINCLVADAFGDIVIMHDLGIERIEKGAAGTHFFGDESGIRDQLPGLNAVATDTQNMIYFGTDKGIIKYNTNRAGATQTNPVPFISALHTPDKRYSSLDKITLAYNESTVTVDYLAFWYQNPDNLLFKYKLENNDDDWITSRDRGVTYSKLPPGSYVFHLMVSDSENFNESNETRLAFVIRPPFWRTTLFYIFMVALVGVSGYGIVVYRERRLQTDKRNLEGEVFKRTTEIVRQNKEIQAQDAAIKSINENLEALVQQRTFELERKNKALEEYAFINAHELRAPVASILGLINLLCKLDLTVKEREVIGHLQESAKRLETVVSDITRAIEGGDYTAN